MINVNDIDSHAKLLSRISFQDTLSCSNLSLTIYVPAKEKSLVSIESEIVPLLSIVNALE